MRLAGRLAAHLPPDAGVTNAAHRALLAFAAPGLGRRSDERARAIAQAMRTTARADFTPAESAWIERIEARRTELLTQSADAGAGLWAPQAAWSMPRIWGRFLLRLVAELRPDSCMEMGAGFGMSGIYQGAALEIAGHGRLHTLDREPTLIPVARRSYEAVGLDSRITLTEGPIGTTLPTVAAAEAPVDYALIDAEHSEAATVQNFEMLLPHLAPGAVVAVDDILSTPDMRRAWDRIRSNRGNRFAVNLRRLGIVCVGGAAG